MVMVVQLMLKLIEFCTSEKNFRVVNSVSNKKVSGACYSGRSKTNGRTSFFGKKVGVYLKA